MGLVGIALAEVAADDVVADGKVDVGAIAQLADGFFDLGTTTFKRIGNDRDKCTGRQQPINDASRHRRDLVHDRAGVAAGLQGVLVGHQPQHAVVIEVVDEDRDSLQLGLGFLRCFETRVTAAELYLAIATAAFQTGKEPMLVDRSPKAGDMLFVDRE